jgi:hypothetical protein
MQQSLLVPLARTGRTVAAALIAGFRRNEDADTVEARLRELPPRLQAQIVGAVLAGLFVASLFAAQFGLPGILVFMLAVILIVR